MCGIGGIHILNPDYSPNYKKLEGAVDLLLASLNHRGGDATGFVASGHEGTVWQKASCDAFDFYKERRPIPWETRSILVHTRMATQGSPAFPENNHPIKRGSVYVVHNGHIWNDWNIFKKAKRERFGQVDSEAIAALVAKYGIMNTHKAMEEISGAAAIGVIDETRPGLMVLARSNSSPLMFYRNNDIAVFGSVKDSVSRAWEYIFGMAPKWNKIEEVKEGVALYLDDKVTRVKFKPEDDYYLKGYAKYSVANEWEDDRFHSFRGNNGVIYCKHGCKEDDCSMCSPELESDELVVVGRGVTSERCELCGDTIEGEYTKVRDLEDDWILCDPCVEELSEVIAENEIHRVTLNENPISELDYLHGNRGG